LNRQASSRLVGYPDVDQIRVLVEGERRAKRKGAEMQVERMKVAPDTVAYADGEHHKLIVEFAIPGAPTETVDVKILEDSVYLLAPARDIEYVSALALGWPVKPDKAEATYVNGLLRIEVPFKDPMEDAVKVTIKVGAADAKVRAVGA
jgi:HSP20 family molecular chaperone IbpA